jgi:ATP-dependent Clp protease protease subunit
MTWTPATIEEGLYGTREIFLQTKHFSNGKLFLAGSITEEAADDFISELLYLHGEQKPVTIYINSPGGSVTAGLSIYDALQAYEGEVNLHCYGMAASMAALILASGKPGHRFITPHARTMIHEPLLANKIGGSASSIEETAKNMLETKEILNELLAKHTNRTKEEIDEATRFDNFMNAEESVAFGLCDEIRNVF